MENKYQITKTIRFKAEPINERAKNLEPALLSSDNDKDLKLLIYKLLEVCELLKSIIYIKDEQGNYKKDDNGRIKYFCLLKIKYTWMRNYLKSNFYANINSLDNPPKKYALKDLGYVKDEIDFRFLPEWEQIITDLQDVQKRSEDNQHPEDKKRYPQIALIINSLSKRSNYEFIKSFVDSLASTNNPEVDKDMQKLKEEITNLGIEIKKQQDNFLPYQSNGLVVAAGSFNYYTINKTSKLLEKKKLEIMDILDEMIYENVGVYNGKECKKIKKQFLCNRSTIAELRLDDELSKLTLNESYYYLKKWKANQKKIFIEALQKGNDEYAKSIKLFLSSDDNFLIIKDRFKKIQDLGAEINNAIDIDEKNRLKKELENIKQQKNDFFNVFASKAQTQKYKELCAFYREIAKIRGNCITKLATIEKEKQVAEQLSYWCLILEKNERHFLYMIPRDENDNTKKAKQYVENLEINNEGSLRLHYFNSLTLSALRKLCFKQVDNTFRSKIKNVDFPKCEQDQAESKKIKFYQDVLNNASTLNLDYYSGIADLCNKEYDSIDDFERELNRICYVKSICVGADIETKLQKDYNALCFEIKSQDIDRYLNSAIDKEKDPHKNKAHTKLWRRFWFTKNQNEGYPIRINPEIRIMYRDSKPSRIAKYGNDSNNFDKNKHNRYLHPQFTLQTTITENALNSNINYAFANTKDKGEAILNYNSKLDTADIKYAFGIDVGTDDLAVLSLIGKDLKPILFDAYRINDENFSKYGYLKGKVKREKPYRIMENPSYFLKKDLYDRTFDDGKYNETFANLFKKVETSALDLTTAKVICDKIILNGDFSTHLHLKILNAKRKITQSLKQNNKIEIYTNDYKIFLKEENKKDSLIFHGKKLYNCIRDFESVEKEIFEFFNEQKLDSVRLDDNINKTRKSLVGNMVGVIDFLYKTYHGFIALENLKQSIIESHRNIFEGDITRPLELALYRKFQTKGLVPPISELIKLREIEKFDNADSKSSKKGSIQQFGIIKFVSEDDTSLLCPSCCKKAYKNSDDENYKRDKENKLFKCGCGFNNKKNPMEYSSLDTNDKIAAFNIAKQGFENSTKQQSK